MKFFFLEKPNLDEFETIFGEVISKWSRQSSHLINVCVNVVLLYIQLFQLKFSPEQSGKVEYERERLLGIANKIHSFISDSQQPFALVFDFSALLGGQS